VKVKKKKKKGADLDHERRQQSGQSKRWTLSARAGKEKKEEKRELIYEGKGRSYLLRKAGEVGRLWGRDQNWGEEF